MPTAILDERDASVAFDIDIQSALKNGGAVQSDMVDNSVLKRPKSVCYLAISTGAIAPTAGQVYNIFLLRGDGNGYRTDGASATKGAIAIRNAKPLGQIRVDPAGDTQFFGDFDTARWGSLGEEWGVAVRNDTDQDPDLTAGDHIKNFTTFFPESQ